MTLVAYDVSVYLTIEIDSDELIFDTASDIIWAHINGIEDTSDFTVLDLQVSSAQAGNAQSQPNEPAARQGEGQKTLHTQQLTKRR